MREEVIGDCRLILGDCREVLPTLGPVDAFVTDPPYGIGVAAKGTVGGKGKVAPTDYGVNEWDHETVDPAIIRHMLECSRWQIIFGGNYYVLPATSCWLVWDKETTGQFADCELAWTNLDKAVRRIRFMWNGMLRANGEERGDHPTQKPVGVMSWALAQLPDKARVIADPFMGSGTTGVACVQLGRQFIGVERETRYFDAACRRVEAETKKPRLFADARPQPTQTALFGDAA